MFPCNVGSFPYLTLISAPNIAPKYISLQRWVFPPSHPTFLRFLPFSLLFLHSCSYSYLLDVMITHGRTVLFVGPTGTGKTVYIKDKLLNRINKEVFQPLVSLI